MPSRTGVRYRKSSACRFVLGTPVRTGNLRDPNGPQSTFASESFIDELAAAAKADPFDFRMKLLTPVQPKQQVHESAIDRGGESGQRSLWVGYASFTKTSANRDILTGVVCVLFRSQTSPRIAEVEVNRQDRPRLGETTRLRATIAGWSSTRKACVVALEGGMLH